MINILYLIIFIEGYVVLSSELILIRLLTPFVGNSIEVICIIISAVLIPLSLGYYYGGSFKPKYTGADRITLREKLHGNFFKSLIFLAVGLTYILANVFFQIFNYVNYGEIIISTSIYVILFIVYPVYLLGQTIPLITNYFPKSELSSITGKVLFFSTIGSFIGSTFSTLGLMPFIGVNLTVVFTLSMLLFLMFLISKNRLGYFNFCGIFIIFCVIFLNSNNFLKKFDVVANDHHGIIKIYDSEDKDGSKILDINHSRSSKYTNNPENQFNYLKYINKNFINNLELNKNCPCNILVIGAGGFSVGKDDTINKYTYVDINARLLDVYEKLLHKKKLEENKKFIGTAARPFINNTKETYDIIVLDAYSNMLTVPTQLITLEFFLSVKKLLTDDGIIIFNSIESPTFSNDFAKKIRNTFSKAFPNYSRHIAQNFNPWEKNPSFGDGPFPVNAIYVYFKKGDTGIDDIYTDDLNSYFMDK